MKREKLLVIQERLHINQKSYLGRIAYAVNRNLNWLDKHRENYEAGKRPSEAYQAYDKARIELCTKHSVKEEGQPKMKDLGNGIQTFTFIDQEAFDKEFEALRAEHKDAIDAHDKQIKDLNKDLETEEETPWYKLKVTMSDIEKLDGNAMWPLMEFLEVTE